MNEKFYGGMFLLNKNRFQGVFRFESKILEEGTCKQKRHGLTRKIDRFNLILIICVNGIVKASIYISHDLQKIKKKDPAGYFTDFNLANFIK